MAWETTGNSGLNPATSYLGTTDVQPLVIRTNGAEALRVGATGSVGVGTSTPGARLHVHGGRNNEWGLIVSSAGGSAYGLKINHGWHGNDVPVLQANALDGNREVPRFVVKAHGRVGVGTAAPAAPLHVIGPVRADSTDTAAGAYDEFIAGTAPWYDFGSVSNRELRVQSFNDGGSYHQFLLYNGRITGGTVASPQYTQGVYQRFCGIEFASGDIHFLVNPGPASNGSEQAITATRALSVESSGRIVVPGDIMLANADCAEEFDVADDAAADAAATEPGTVMAVDGAGALRPCESAYDRRVAGVISGAGDFRPAIVLDRRPSQRTRVPIALMGKVTCKVDASYAPIEAGDLLTTSPTPGRAMKATDPALSLGAVIGKALRPLDAGQGAIPVLVG
jgi:hypothetical protein